MSRCTCGAERVYAGRALELCERCGVLATLHEGVATALWNAGGIRVSRTRAPTKLSGYRTAAAPGEDLELRVRRGWTLTHHPGRAVWSAFAVVGAIALAAFVLATAPRPLGLVVAGLVALAGAAIVLLGLVVWPRTLAITRERLFDARWRPNRRLEWRRASGDRLLHTNEMPRQLYALTPGAQTGGRWWTVRLSREIGPVATTLFDGMSETEARFVAHIVSLLLERAVPVDDDDRVVCA